MTEVRITLETAPALDDLQLLRHRVVAHNVALTRAAPPSPFAFFARGGAGTIVGGLSGALWTGWLVIDVLWVSEPLRRRGHGRALLNAAETHARREGCRHAFVEAFDFDALPFYERCGYEIAAALDGFPAGHRLCLLRKRL
jgi:GNAT superfamily N-acetyltransferase